MSRHVVLWRVILGAILVFLFSKKWGRVSMVLVLISVKLMVIVVKVTDSLVFGTYFSFDELANSLMFCIQVQIIDNVERCNFVSLILGQVSAVYSEGIFWAHGEGWATSARLIVLFMLWILTYWNHSNRLLRTLGVWDISLIMVVFLASYSCVLFQIRI